MRSRRVPTNKRIEREKEKEKEKLLQIEKTVSWLERKFFLQSFQKFLAAQNGKEKEILKVVGRGRTRVYLRKRSAMNQQVIPK